MYHSQHSDPYAGQYPPPPPLQIDTQQPSFSTPLQHEGYTPHYPQQQNEGYTPHYTPPQQQQQQEGYVPYYPQQQEQHVQYPQQQEHEGLYSQQTYPQEAYIPPPPATTTHPYRADTSSSLDAYLRQEREEYLKNEPKQETIPLTQDPEKAPMLYQPHVAKPTPAPPNEANSYQYTPYQQKQKSCSCCCYNPAITCCSFFMLLVSIAFCAAGIALIIASKVISGKCDSSCTNISEQVASTCDTICNTVLQNGLFYGGIVVAGLAGIAIIWKLVMWTCAGYSQRH